MNKKYLIFPVVMDPQTREALEVLVADSFPPNRSRVIRELIRREAARMEKKAQAAETK